MLLIEEIQFYIFCKEKHFYSVMQNCKVLRFEDFDKI